MLEKPNFAIIYQWLQNHWYIITIARSRYLYDNNNEDPLMLLPQLHILEQYVFSEFGD